MFPFGLIPLLLFLFLLILFPLILADVMLSALARLGLDPGTSLLAALGILLGGMINIPVKRIRRENPVKHTPSGLYGIERMMPGLVKQSNYTTIAVNIGGCVVPSIIVIYQIIRLAGEGSMALITVSGAALINIVFCYFFARPVRGVGIALSPIIPAVVAALCGVLFIPDLAPVIAFVSGVTGPLVGADLLNLNKISKISTGVASIGGAGTFDGIVISGFLATLLTW
ncbi:MAG: DUF1614 domain-containing protein [Chitinivibrionales bacterium]|nr:DUF1614 domain-containing protein [Chitinivibrionales bacterium]